MLTKHIKIKQLNTASKKSSSNNDLLIIETPLTIRINKMEHNVTCISQFNEFLIQGLCFKYHQSLQKVKLQNDTTHDYDVSFLDDYHTLAPLPITDVTLQPHHIVDWVRLFKEKQTLYRQTGGTETVGILDETGHIFAIECISFETAYLKLLGALIKKDMPFFPVLFVSHRIALSQAKMIQSLPMAMVICQSAITDQALNQFIAAKQTVYGFCRKNKFNRYSNFHL
tara:strand:+ start:1081 stop:1758 length:678 start_codon:yes stop_codon:yes gene_type:complete